MGRGRNRNRYRGSQSRKTDLEYVIKAGFEMGVRRYLSRSWWSRFNRLFTRVDVRKDIALATVTLSIFVFGENRTEDVIDEEAIERIHNGDFEPWQSMWHASLVEEGLIGTRYENSVAKSSADR